MKTISLGPLKIYPYGLALAVSALFALLLMQLQSENQKGNGQRSGHLKAGTVSWFAVFAIPLGLLLGRFAYFLCSLSWFLDRGVETVFRLNEGGYMFYGVMAGLALAAFVTGKITRQRPAAIMDAAAAPFALFVALARAAEFFANTGMGEYVEEWFDPMLERTMFPLEDASFFLRFPFALQDQYGDWCFAVFLLEAIAALVIFFLVNRSECRRAGTKALLFLALYASLQTVLESLRIDLELKWGFVKVNQLLVLPALALVTCCCLVRARGRQDLFRSVLVRAGLILLCCGVIMAMEFALEKKIGFLAWMRMDLCWMVMGAAAITMAVISGGMVKKTDLIQEGAA